MSKIVMYQGKECCVREYIARKLDELLKEPIAVCSVLAVLNVISNCDSEYVSREDVHEAYTVTPEYYRQCYKVLDFEEDDVAIGIAGIWKPSHKTSFLDYCDMHEANVFSLEAQVDWLVYFIADNSELMTTLTNPDNDMYKYFSSFIDAIGRGQYSRKKLCKDMTIHRLIYEVNGFLDDYYDSEWWRVNTI